MFYYLARLLKFIFYGADLVLLTPILYLMSFLPITSVTKFYPHIFWFWCQVFVRALDVDLRLHQKNANPLPKQYILVANHPSAFEDIGIPALFPVYSLAKIEVKDWWIVGRISMAAGTLYVRREEKESRKEAYEHIIEEVRKGKNIALYPEGGCKGRRIFESFRYGAFDISLQTGIPILPVFLHYETQDDFEWKPGESLLAKIWHILTSKNRCVNYYVFDAINPSEFDSKEQYTEHVYNLYLQWQARYLE